MGIPTCPRPFLASSQHSSTGFLADPQILTRQPGNASPATNSGRQSNINPAPRQHIWHTLSHINPAPRQHTRRTLSHSHINPAQWQHFPAHAQTLTQHGTHFPRIPGTAPAPFLTQHGNNTYYTTKKGLKYE